MLFDNRETSNSFLKSYISNLNLIQEKLELIEKDINNAEKDVETDFRKIIDMEIRGDNEDDMRKKKRLISQINKEFLVNIKRKYLNEAKKELIELAHRIKKRIY